MSSRVQHLLVLLSLSPFHEDFSLAIPSFSPGISLAEPNRVQKWRETSWVPERWQVRPSSRADGRQYHAVALTGRAACQLLPLPGGCLPLAALSLP